MLHEKNSLQILDYKIFESLLLMELIIGLKIFFQRLPSRF